VSEDFLQKIFAAIAKDNKTELEVSVADQTITIKSTGEKRVLISIRIRRPA
jgi:hypothetical protein